jgi:hypothetical protein
VITLFLNVLTLVALVVVSRTAPLIYSCRIVHLVIVVIFMFLLRPSYVAYCLHKVFILALCSPCFFLHNIKLIQTKPKLPFFLTYTTLQKQTTPLHQFICYCCFSTGSHWHTPSNLQFCILQKKTLHFLTKLP